MDTSLFGGKNKYREKQFSTPLFLGNLKFAVDGRPELPSLLSKCHFLAKATLRKGMGNGSGRKAKRKCRVSSVALLNFYANARHAHMNNNIYIQSYMHIKKREYYFEGVFPHLSALCKWKVKTFMCTFFMVFYGTPLLWGVAAGWPTQHYATSRCDFALFMTFMQPPDRPGRHKYCCKAKNK